MEYHIVRNFKMESKGSSTAECKDIAPRDLVTYFSQLHVASDLAEVYMRTLQALNIADKKALKEELISRLLIGIGRGSALHARTAQTLYSVFVKNYHRDSYHHGPARAFERPQDTLILDSLCAIVAATGTSRYANIYDNLVVFLASITKYLLHFFLKL